MRIKILVTAIVLPALAALIAYVFLPAMKEADARRKLPFESLTERLPKGKPIPPTRALNSASKKRWEKLDEELARSQDRRASLLKELHERTRRFFVESPGEGPGRRVATPEEILLDDYDPEWTNTNQPG